jgi:ferredoxin--NADP+ reductase
MKYKIVQKKELAPKIKLFEIRALGIATGAKPGQFVVLRIDKKGERFPLTITHVEPSEGTFKIVFNEVGKSTKRLGQLKEGENILDVVGPLGNPSEIKNYGKVLCFGGGVMAPPLSFVTSALRDAGNEIFGVIGARSKDLLIFKDEMKAIAHKFFVTTDDGSEGYKGINFIKKIVVREKIKRVVAMSTSEATLKAICETTKPLRIATIVSLAPIMVDATGMCGACRVFIDGEMKLTCIDGPEFDGHMVDWGALISRKRMYMPEERISSLSYERFGDKIFGVTQDKKVCNCNKGNTL